MALRLPLDHSQWSPLCVLTLCLCRVQYFLTSNQKVDFLSAFLFFIYFFCSSFPPMPLSALSFVLVLLRNETPLRGVTADCVQLALHFLTEDFGSHLKH